MIEHHVAEAFSFSSRENVLYVYEFPQAISSLAFVDMNHFY